MRTRYAPVVPDDPPDLPFAEWKEEQLGRPITPRQREVLALAAEGLRNDAIGAMLGVSHWAIRRHKYVAICRLGANNTTHAVVLAIGRGFIPLHPALAA